MYLTIPPPLKLCLLDIPVGSPKRTLFILENGCALKYFPISTPIHFLPILWDTAWVVPLPIKKSITISFSSVSVETTLSNNSSAFSVEKSDPKAYPFRSVQLSSIGTSGDC